MYPLHMSNGIGFALANDENEHRALTDAGYEPPIEDAGDELDSLRTLADGKGIAYDRRWGVKRMRELLA